MIDLQWYLTRNAEQFGPYSWENLVSFYHEGNLLPDDLLWNETMTEWQRADHVAGLGFTSKPPPTQGYSSAILPNIAKQGIETFKKIIPGTAKPWQVFVGNQLPSAATQGIFQPVSQPSKHSFSQLLAPVSAQSDTSLLGPAFQAFTTTLLETLTPLLTVGVINPGAAVPKIILALINLAAGAIAGKRRGVASIIMLVASMGLTLLQGGSLLGTLQQLLDNPSMLGDLLPSGVMQGLSILAAVRAGLKSVQK